MRILKFFCFALFISAHAHGQNHSVDPLTGAMNMEIPVFTLADGDVKFPISLTYRTNGISVNAASDLFGHGWSLTADASISRDVRSLPDDYLGSGLDTRKGWLHGDMGTRIKNFTINTDDDDNTCADEVTNYNFLNSFGYNEDTEPDVFHVNAPGLSFQFYFDENQLPQVVPLTDVKITYTTDPGTDQITSFTVVDPKGYSYVFAAIEKTKDKINNTASLLHGHAYYRQYRLYNVPCTYTTSWKLTQINSPVYGQINLNYRDLTHKNDPGSGGTISVGLGESEDALIFKTPVKLKNYWNAWQEIFKTDIVFYQKVLESVSTPSHEVEFIPMTKPDSTDVVTSIKIYDKRTSSPTLVKEYGLTYSSYQYFEHTGHSIPVWWDAGDIMVGTRSYLISVQEKIGTSLMPALSFEYYGTGQVNFPKSDSEEKDEWGFFKSTSHSYWESMTALSLKRIKYPTGGYTVIFYQPHDYYDNATSTTKTGGGIRVKKIVSHDGLSSSSDVTEEYEYLNTSGQSSGKLVHKPTFEISTLKINIGFPYTSGGSTLTIQNPWYRQVDSLVTASLVPGPTGKYFKLTAPFEPGDYELVSGSQVAYERVIKKQAGAGRTIYEYELPAMAGDVTASGGEWEASQSNIARPSSGGSWCFDARGIPRGSYQYPYPRNPNYSFARGLVKKITDENEAGDKVRETEFTYQRVYGGSAIKKIYGIALEELRTNGYNGSSGTYPTAKMFLYGKYPVFTDVKIELDEKKETLYYSSDLTKKTETTTTFYYASANHREMTKVVTTNSDLTESVTKFSYVKDYVVITPSGTNAANLVKLKNAHRNEVIETLSSTINSGSEKFISGTLLLFQEISTKMYPYQVWSFNSADGLATFTPAAITGGNAFGYDSNYDLKNTITAFNSTGAPKEQVGKDRVVHSTVWGFNGTLPIMQIANAKLNEVGYSDFDNANDVDFTGWGSASTTGGTTGANAIIMPNTMVLSRTITNNGSQRYVFSCWVQSPYNGDLTLRIKDGSTNLITPIDLSYVAGEEKFLSTTVVTTGFPSSFTVSISTSTTIGIDNVTVFPTHAQVSFNSYTLPYGIEATTNMMGRSIFYAYDEWGRVITVRDQDNNILNKRSYHIKP